MTIILLIVIAIAFSILCHCNFPGEDILWWNPHIGTIVIILVLLILLLDRKRCTVNRERILKYSLVAIGVGGTICAIVANINNSSIYSMCITLSVPAIIYMYVCGNIYVKYVSGISFLICFVAVTLSTSRTGIIAMSLSTVFLLSHIFQLKSRASSIIAFTVICSLFSVLLFIKSSSSNGRIFIIERTIEMIKEKPCGWGRNGFERNYMLFQAEYFKNNDNEKEAILASDIKHPLNEFLYLAVNYGIHTLLVVIFAVAYIIWRISKTKNKERICFLHFLLLVILWSCFSYPFSISYTYVVLTAFFVAFVNNRYINNAIRVFKYPIIIVLLLFTYKEINSIKDETIWNNAVNDYKNGNKIEAMKVFSKADSYSIDKGAMLFSLATVAYNEMNYEKCIELCNDCRDFFSNYDLEFLTANSYLFIGELCEAEKHFITAHNMCPNRFIPLYKLFKIYKQRGNKEQMTEMGEKILSKKIKVPSRSIDIIINNVKYELQDI
ncbi:MAG: O-antigen ligase family protein [Bacteroidales bacterium]|nr:O-antigen ligase family protein [Bacteroidales bacterium]